MTPRAAWLRGWLVVALLGLAFATRAEGTDPPADARAAREVLVMLRLPAPHFRPDADYGGGYVRQAGSSGRQRIAEELAARFHLRLVGSWPMPALGVDCFVMEVPANLALEPLIESMA